MAVSNIPLDCSANIAQASPTGILFFAYAKKISECLLKKFVQKKR
jgi:hypothetical protein